MGALRAAKLRAIAAAHLDLDVDANQGEPLADGAALATADRAVLLIARPTRRSLGPALSWAAKRFDGADAGHGLARVDLVLDPTVPVDEHPVDHDPVLAGVSAAGDDRYGLAEGDAAAVGAQLARIGEPHDRTPAQVSLAWLIAKGAVPIPGAKNAGQASQNAGSLGWSLTPEELEVLDGLALSGQRTISQRIWQHG